MQDQSTLVPARKPGLLRRLYNWCIDAAGKPHAAWMLGTVKDHKRSPVLCAVATMRPAWPTA